jgi:hypothetical protein
LTKIRIKFDFQNKYLVDPVFLSKYLDMSKIMHIFAENLIYRGKFMKKSECFFYGVFFAFLLLFLTSCGDQRSVKRTARAFLHSYYIDGDFETAKKNSTRLTHENIEMREMLLRLNPNSETDRFRNFSIHNADIRRTKAVVFYVVDDIERRLNLSKIDGKWLVDMPESTSLDPGFSLSPIRGGRGFASATSEPTRLRDVPPDDPNDSPK